VDLEHLHKVTFNDFLKLLINSAGKPLGPSAFLCSIPKIASRISFVVKGKARDSFSSYVTCGISPIPELSRAHKDSSGGPNGFFKIILSFKLSLLPIKRENVLSSMLAIDNYVKIQCVIIS